MGLRSWWRGRQGSTALARVHAYQEERAMQALIAELRSIRPQDLLPTHLANKPLWSNWDTTKAIKDGMKASTWVYACIMKTALAISSIPWTVVRINPDGTEEPDLDNGLSLLLRKPNIAWGWQTSTQFMVMHLLLSGNSITTKCRAFEAPAELWPHNPAFIKPVPSKEEFIKEYEFCTPGTRKIEKVAPSELIHIMLPDPENPRWGLSPMMAGMRAIDVDRESAIWQKTSLQNLMVPPFAYTFPKNFTKEQIARAQERLKEQQQGPKNARKTAFVGGGAQLHKLSLTPVEMDWMKSREMNAEEICSIYDVPPPMVGLLRMAKYANFETAERQWWEARLIPFVWLIIDAYNRQLAPEFATSTGVGRLEIRPDFSNVAALLTRFAERVAIAKELWSMGYSANIVNQRLQLGMPTTPEGDVSYVASSVVPTSAPSEEQLEERIRLIKGGR